MRVSFNPPLHTVAPDTQRALVALAHAASEQIKAGEPHMNFKYRKKPVVIEAFKYDKAQGSVTTGYPSWLVQAAARGVVFFKNGEAYIHTLEGEHHVSDGDYIIQGVQGELYPCKPDIFAATYEAVE